MQTSVWAEGSNPSMERRLVRKSLAYCADMVTRGWYRWIDPTDPQKGCFAKSSLRPAADPSREHKMAAGTMRAAWGTVQSGYAGPLVFQMRRQQFQTSLS